MARHRDRGTLVDYLVAAIEPALIMIMVGSLMFFLLDMWYEGEYLERMRWILFWFVLGIVLITRVSMRIDSSLAKAYGIALGGAVALVATRFSGFQPVLLAILGFVWWATHKLTFDCTLLDEDQDAGVGLLKESGLEQAPPPDPDSEPAASLESDDPNAMDASLLPGGAEWKRRERQKDEARRPNAPGVWLIYFTLASLPVFALGQWLVPAVEEDRRNALFFYFLAYISSGMGLLLATSFLNLRRYLRQRKLKMPAAMTATWLSTGAVLIVGLTLFAAALPLPGTGWSVVRGSTRQASPFRASQVAPLKDGGAEGKGAGGEKNDEKAEQQTSGKGKEGGKNGPGNAKSGAARGKASKSGAASKQGSPRQDDSGEKKDKGAERSGEKSEQDKKSDKNDNNNNADDKKADSSSSKDEQSDRKNDDSSSASNRPPRSPSLTFQAPSWLRGLLSVVGVLVLLYGLFRYGPILLDALRALFASLFGGFGGQKPRKSKKDAESSAASTAIPPRPFASFADPFATGLASNFSPNDLIVYSFEALEAWAFEQNLARFPTRRRRNSSRGSVRQNLTCGRIQPGWPAILSRLCMVKKASKPKCCRHCGNSGGPCKACPREFDRAAAMPKGARLARASILPRAR